MPCRLSLLDETVETRLPWLDFSLSRRPCRAISVLHKHNSTVSRQLRYSPSRACVCLPPGFLTLWLYLPSCRFAHGYCRGLALCMFAILLLFPLGCCRGLALCMLVILLRFPLGCCLGLALCVLVICVCFARSPPGSLGFARSLRGFAQG